jgi:hypothetical protein
MPHLHKLEADISLKNKNTVQENLQISVFENLTRQRQADKVTFNLFNRIPMAGGVESTKFSVEQLRFPPRFER